jgi:GT2 family glycosyltransferase/glycosyltransferase involved in cell wall biosynthesis
VVEHPLVSVVLVNYRSVDDTLTAVRHLKALPEYPENLEIIVVDNASGDGSLLALNSIATEVTVIPSSTNLGFAGGCNLGVTHASGEIVAFLNNDARPGDTWVSAALADFDTYDSVGAVASRVLDWEGKRIDFAGAGLTWYGMGYRPHTGEKARSRQEQARPVLFGTGAAMFVRRSVFDQLGGFDESFFMFFEDVDFGWRLNLAGWTYLYQPESLAYHRYHGSMGGVAAHREQFLLERNALYCLYKNLDEHNLSRILPGALLASVRRAVVASGVDSTSLDLSQGGSHQDVVTLPSDAVVPLYAMDQFVEALPELITKRAEIQSTRKRSDVAMWKLFGETNAAMSTDARYLRGYDSIVEALGVTDDPLSSTVLIITGDPIGTKLSGPGIRAWHIAQALAQTNDVALLSLSGVDAATTSDFRLVHVAPGDDREFAQWEKWADIIIFQGHALDVFPALRTSKKYRIVDIYDPMHLEQLEQARHLPKEQWQRHVADATQTLEAQLRVGDFFLCASERQRHFYLGQLTTLGRVTPDVYENDPHLRQLIDVVPFGFPDEDPVPTRSVLRGVHPGIGDDDALIVWSGGIYDWFDPLTLITAVAILADTRPNVRLFFMGTQHPHPGVPEMPIIQKSREHASELGILDVHVFFNDSWVEYSDRHNYLLEADLGVSTHQSHIETTFSFRTRILDYLWASLPMVVTEGDHFGDLVAQKGLGGSVPAGNVDALVAALETYLFDPKARDKAVKALGAVRKEYRWSRTLSPLVEHVRHVSTGAIGKTHQPLRFSPQRPRPPRLSIHDLKRGVERLLRGEFRSLWRAVLRKLRPRRG